MKSNFIRFFIFIGTFLTVLSLSAQRPIIYEDPEYRFNFAMELLQKEQYGAADEYFKKVYEDVRAEEEVRVNSYFYRGVCALQLNHPDADFLLKNFVRNYPVHANVKRAYFLLGRYYFDQRKYKQALEYFNEIDERSLTGDELTEYRFKNGYSYFMAKKYDDAKYWFATVRKDTACKSYQNDATYYTAHIAYSNKQYEAALQDFLLLKDVPEYQGTVPFYITQIYFLQKHYDDALATAVPLLPEADNKTEMNRLIALSYYNLGKYEEAAPYFNAYLSDAKVLPTRDDRYAIGYTYYQNKEYEKAIPHLAYTTTELDTTAQNSYYIIGDCYLKTGDSRMAMQSFSEAAKMDYSEDVKEDAMYNYAKLQYETSDKAFNTAIKALEQYVNTYPYTTRGEEATAYLSDIYMSTKNYQGAIKSLEELTSKSPKMLKAYQRCTHFRALELINNQNYKGALKMIEKSMSYPMNANLQTSNLYWKAECEYRLEDYQKSYYSFQSYYKNNKVKEDENYANSYYSYGYAALKTKKYNEAESAFKTFLGSKASDNTTLKADATARLGDCCFMQKNLLSAISQYEKCENMGEFNADYALYQQAKCYNYLEKANKKIECLEKLCSQYSKSTYLDDAEYDLATAYHSQNDYALAITMYKNFIKKHPKSPYIRQAYNKLAQAYLNTQETDAAVSTFKHVFETYPGSAEAKDALANLETIYAESGTMGEFFAYIKNKGNININLEKQDSLTFKAAETKYNRGDCEAAIKGFESYLKEFPNGFFAATAYFNKGECEYGMKDYDQALADYEALLKKYNTQYNETACRKAALILYNKKEYEKSLTRFTQLSETAASSNDLLLAHTGIMRAAWEVGKYPTAQKSAEFLLLQDNTDAELKTEARYIAGKSAYTLGDKNIAKKHLTPLAKNSTNDMSAEAAYITALIEFQQNDLDNCEKIINEILSANYSSEYWYASTFILYGDWYLAKGNSFQAKHTYKSIVDNYEGEDLKAIAQEKINKIEEAEAAAKREEELQREHQQQEIENSND